MSSSTHGKGTVMQRISSSSMKLAEQSFACDLAAPDAALTLDKKHSWYGSLRAMVQKHALHAKVTVDAVRCLEPWKPAAQASAIPCEEQPDNDETDRTNQIDETQPSTPSKRSDSVTDCFQNHPTPSRSALSSLRRHLRDRSPVLNRKRSSLAVGSPDLSKSNFVERSGLSAGHVAATPQGDNNGSVIPRKGSVTRSIVGSIRTLARRHHHVTSSASPLKDTESRQSAETVPLPSSPIDIPTVAPSLELDLGPRGLDASPTKIFNRTLATIDADGILIEPSPSTSDMQQCMARTTGQIFRRGAFAPIDLSHFPIDALGRTPPTPMPGTNLLLEVDGSFGDESNVFERGVSPETEKQRTELRAMRSIDAMATISSPSDRQGCDGVDTLCGENATTSDSSPRTQMSTSSSIRNEHSNTPDVHDDFRSATAKSSVRDHFPSPSDSSRKQIIRDISTASTILTCPDDMSSLGRKHHIEASVACAHSSASGVALTSPHDPSADEQSVSGFGLPSSDRSVRLPFRPKTISSPSMIHFDPEAGEQLSSVNHSSLPHAQSRHRYRADVLEDRPSHSLEMPGQSQQNAGTAESVVEHSLSSHGRTYTPAHTPRPNFIPLPEYDNAFANLTRAQPEAKHPHTSLPLASQTHAARRELHIQHGSPSRTAYFAGLGNSALNLPFERWFKDPPHGSAAQQENNLGEDGSLMDMGTISMPDAVALTQDDLASHMLAVDIGSDLTFKVRTSVRSSQYASSCRGAAAALGECDMSPMQLDPVETKHSTEYERSDGNDDDEAAYVNMAFTDDKHDMRRTRHPLRLTVASTTASRPMSSAYAGQSSPKHPFIVAGQENYHRLNSSHTLDETLDLFGSPESEGGVYATSSTDEGIPLTLSASVKLSPKRDQSQKGRIVEGRGQRRSNGAP